MSVDWNLLNGKSRAKMIGFVNLIQLIFDLYTIKKGMKNEWKICFGMHELTFHIFLLFFTNRWENDFISLNISNSIGLGSFIGHTSSWYIFWMFFEVHTIETMTRSKHTYSDNNRMLRWHLFHFLASFGSPYIWTFEDTKCLEYKHTHTQIEYLAFYRLSTRWFSTDSMFSKTITYTQDQWSNGQMNE